MNKNIDIYDVAVIGAGPAGMMAAIYLNQITSDRLDKMGDEDWSKVISMGVEFATNVCLSYENYISLEFAKKLNAWAIEIGRSAIRSSPSRENVS